MTPRNSKKPTALLPLDVDAFMLALECCGYAASTLRGKRHLVVDLVRWLDEHQLEPNGLDERVVESFLQDRKRRGLRSHSHAATLRALLSHLRGSEVEPSLGRPLGGEVGSAIDREFAEFLTKQRAVAPVTRDNYLRLVRRFAMDRFGGGPIEPKALSPADVVEFAERYSDGRSHRLTQLMGTALRAFFRFLRQRGDIEVDLGAAVPRMANWRFSELPKGLEPEQVEQVLQAFDCDTAIGRRDYAIILLLARLGLRAGEVVVLTLDDLDWKTGVLLVRGKGPRCDPMPLPVDVGEALVAYLRNGRPLCSTRRVFVRAKAPLRGFASSVAICTIVQRALTRAGLEPPRRGAHIFRHALASQMLRRGASLPQIGDVLRHRRPDTTMIYTKVDLVALRSLARAWPGGGA